MAASFSSSNVEGYFNEGMWPISDQSTCMAGRYDLSTPCVNFDVTPSADLSTPQLCMESDGSPFLITEPAAGHVDGGEVQGYDYFMPHSSAQVAMASTTPIEISDRSFAGLEELTSVPSSEMMTTVWKDIIENMTKGDAIEETNQTRL